jgi:hypothetical protein
LKVWGPQNDRRFFGEKHWAEPIKWNRNAARDGVRRRVFCASMADVFEDRPDLAEPQANAIDLRIKIGKRILEDLARDFDTRIRA